MQIETSPSATRNTVRKCRRNQMTIGVVPTMGGLHAGHVSLIEAARKECDYVVTTIFVNPTQFGPGEDFSRYPRTLETDLQMCEVAGADLAFTPTTSEMYLPDAQSVVHIDDLSKRLEGAVRPTHFDGVTTIVAKLFNITEPDRAYFGQKDYQQQLIIRRMVRDLDFGLEVVTCPIVREPDGLAMSSRNRYLSDADRERSLVLYRTLELAQQLWRQPTNDVERITQEMLGALDSAEGVQPDYAVVVDPETLMPACGRPETAVALIAAKVGETRLIDNLILQFR